MSTVFANPFQYLGVYSNIDDRRKYFVALSSKIFVTSLFVICLIFTANAQRIVVDSTSTNKYLIKPEATVKDQSKDKSTTEDDLSFGDRALSIGKGIINRLKARLNLEEAAESIKGKKDKILGKNEEEEEKKEEEDGG